MLRMFFHSLKELRFTLSIASRRYPTIKYTDTDYDNDLAFTSDYLKNAKILLHQLETTADEIGLFVNAKKTEIIYYNQVYFGYINPRNASAAIT